MVLGILSRPSAEDAGALMGNGTSWAATLGPYNVSRACTVQADALVNYGYEISFIVAVVTIVALSFCYDRDKGQPPRRLGWPLFVMPLDLMDYGNRWNYVAAFGVMASSIIVIFTGQDAAGQFSTVEYNDTMATYFSSLVIMARAVETAISFYPMFACVMARKSVVVFFVGFVFTGIKFAGVLYLTLICPDPVPEVMPFLILLVNLPGLCCLGWLAMMFFYRTLRAMWKGHWHRARQRGLSVYDFQKARVQQLLIPRSLQKPPEPPETTGDRIRLKLTDLWHEYIYDGGRQFRYPNRIICAMAVIWFCTYQIGLVIMAVSRNIDNFSYELVSSTNAIVEVFALFGIDVDINTLTKTIVNMFLYSWLVPGIIIIIIRLWHTALIFSNYRIHSISLWRGNHSFIPATYTMDRSQIVPQILRFAGYQVAYILWAFLLLQIVGFLVCLLFCIIVILPLIIGYYNIAIWLSNVFLVPSVVSLLIFYICSWVSKLIHLNNDKTVGDETNYRSVGFKNMNLFPFTDFIFFVLNIATGLFSALWRVTLSFLLGLFYMGRMDQCVFFPGFESWDKGYNCYIGLLATEQLILHPVLRVFIDLINSKRNRNSQHVCAAAQEVGADTHGEADEESGDPHTTEGPHCIPLTPRRIRQRWLLLYTLVRNPGLVQHRRQGPRTEDSVKTSTLAYILTTVAGAFEKRINSAHWNGDAIPDDDGGGIRLVAARTPEMPHDIKKREDGHISNMEPDVNQGFEDGDIYSF